MVDLLSGCDTKIVGVALEALENIVKTGKTKQQENGLPENPCCALIEQADGLTKIEQLQEDPNEEVYAKAMHILEDYFPLDDADGGDFADTTHDGGMAFGAGVP